MENFYQIAAEEVAHEALFHRVPEVFDEGAEIESVL